MTLFQHETLSRTERYAGPIFTVFSDQVTMSDGEPAMRDVVENKGAVGVVAVDEVGRVVLVRQYRHAVRRRLWELPAGLRDADGEPPVDTARRELAEEVGLAAERWSLLVTQHPSPGFCDELVYLYLAEGLTDVGKPVDFVVEHEEADMTVERIPLADAVQQVFDGTIRNSLAVIGLLAADQVRSRPVRLRPVDWT
jgi:8-oxo-dGDP phosphatase